MYTENIKKNCIGKVLEDAPFIKINECKRIYHSFTQDLVSNEIFRRVHPEGLTMAEHFEKNMKDQFGLDGIYMRMTDQDLPKTFNFSLAAMGKQMKTAKSKVADERISTIGGFMDGYRLMKRMGPIEAATLENIDTKKYKYRPEEQAFKGMGFSNFTHPTLKKGENTSAFTWANAKTMARFGAFMANKGTLNGQTLISEETWNASISDTTCELDQVGMYTKYSKGGFNLYEHSSKQTYDKNARFWSPDTETIQAWSGDNRDGFYGWMGLGGSIL